MTSSSRGSGPSRSGPGGNDTPSSTAVSLPDPDVDELRTLLVNLRGKRSQRTAAEIATLKQSTIARAELGTTPFTAKEADRYARLLGADPDVRARIAELSGLSHDLTIVGRGALLRNADEIQRRTGLLEASVGVVRSWQPELIPGALQTPAYTAAMARAEGVEPSEEWLAARASRRGRLTEPQPVWHQLVSEATLRWIVADRATQAEQLDHLHALSRQSNMRFGVLPLDVPMPLPAPASFHIYGGRAVQVAVFSRTVFLTARDDLAAYRAQFDQLAAIALYDDEARDILSRLASRYREDHP